MKDVCPFPSCLPCRRCGSHIMILTVFLDVVSVKTFVLVFVLTVVVVLDVIVMVVIVVLVAFVVVHFFFHVVVVTVVFLW